MVEKAVLEEALQQKEAREQRLVEELESTRTQLQELGEEHALLQRQRDALSAGLGEPEKGGSRVMGLEKTNTSTGAFDASFLKDGASCDLILFSVIVMMSLNSWVEMFI